MSLAALVRVNLRAISVFNSFLLLPYMVGLAEPAIICRFELWHTSQVDHESMEDVCSVTVVLVRLRYVFTPHVHPRLTNLIVLTPYSVCFLMNHANKSLMCLEDSFVVRFAKEVRKLFNLPVRLFTIYHRGLITNVIFI